MRWTANDIARLRRANPAKASRRAMHKPGEMNKTEAKYAERLEALKRSGEVLDYAFECVKLKLADRTFYTPDFMVLNKDGIVEMHEVKGFWEDDARVKIKVAAAQFPFKFVGVQSKCGAFVTEEF